MDMSPSSGSPGDTIVVWYKASASATTIKTREVIVPETFLTTIYLVAYKSITSEETSYGTTTSSIAFNVIPALEPHYIIDSQDLKSVADKIRYVAGTNSGMEFPDGFIDTLDEITPNLPELPDPSTWGTSGIFTLDRDYKISHSFTIPEDYTLQSGLSPHRIILNMQNADDVLIVNGGIDIYNLDDYFGGRGNIVIDTSDWHRGFLCEGTVEIYGDVVVKGRFRIDDLGYLKSLTINGSLTIGSNGSFVFLSNKQTVNGNITNNNGTLRFYGEEPDFLDYTNNYDITNYGYLEIGGTNFTNNGTISNFNRMSVLGNVTYGGTGRVDNIGGEIYEYNPGTIPYTNWVRE